MSQTNDPTAHAEILAIREACTRLGTEHLTGCTIYVLAHPCPMCLGSLYYCSPEKVVFLTQRDDYEPDYVDDRKYFELATFYAEFAKDWTEPRLPMEYQPRDAAIRPTTLGWLILLPLLVATARACAARSIAFVRSIWPKSASITTASCDIGSSAGFAESTRIGSARFRTPTPRLARARVRFRVSRTVRPSRSEVWTTLTSPSRAWAGASWRPWRLVGTLISCPHRFACRGFPRCAAHRPAGQGLV